MGLSVCLSWGHCGAQFIPALSLPLNPGVLLPVHASARAQDSRGGGGGSDHRPVSWTGSGVGCEPTRYVGTGLGWAERVSWWGWGEWTLGAQCHWNLVV